MDTERILHEIERQERERSARFRQFMIDEGHADRLPEFDRKMRDIVTGVDGARRTWEALTEPQRRVMRELDGRLYLIRCPASRTRYEAHGEPHATGDLCGLPTVRNLIARELLACDGGALDPERKLVMTERGAFVLRHGQPPADGE